MNQSNQNKNAYHKISPKEAYSMMMENKQITILDVRTQEEFDEGHIRNARLIPCDKIESHIDVLPDKDTSVLVYCHSGYRSKIAADTLVAMGYQNIYDFGGITDWNYEIIK